MRRGAVAPGTFPITSRSARTLVAALAVALCVSPAVAAARAWRPDMAAAIAYARHRHAGDIAFAVRTQNRAYGWHARHTFPSASLLKPILLAAYLNRPSVRHRGLTVGERDLLRPMIERSDNNAASTVLGIVGLAALREIGRRAHMARFVPVGGVWGLSRIDAEDQARFFLHIDRIFPARHRRYAMHLLASITRSQRWGIGEVAPRGWRLYFKGGWGYGTGFVDHQTALLIRGKRRVAVSVLTIYDGSHAYGKATLRGIFKRLLRGL